jgi:hypothetical protein
MCWSFQASIITWIIGLATSIYLLCRHHKNDIVMGLLILTYSSMQLWEALMWYDQKCGKLNKIGTQLAYYALSSHILAIGIGLFIEYKVKIPLIVGAAVLLAAIIFRPKKWDCSVKGENGHLKWGFEPGFYIYIFAIALAFCLYYIKPFNVALLISALFLASFIFTLLFGTETAGSFWCWISACFGFLFILVNNLSAN